MTIYLTKDRKSGYEDREEFTPSELERAAELLVERGFEKELRGYRVPDDETQYVQLTSPLQVHIQEIPRSLLHDLVDVLNPNYFYDTSRHEGTAFAPIAELYL